MVNAVVRFVSLLFLLLWAGMLIWYLPGAASLGDALGILMLTTILIGGMNLLWVGAFRVVELLECLLRKIGC